MQKATATYVPPVGDSKVVEMGGVTFFAGQPVDLNSDDHAHLISKLDGNTHFDLEKGKDDEKPQPVAKKRGRPSAADRVAAKEAAEAADKAAKDAADKAKAAKAELEATEKAATEREPDGRPPTPQTRDTKAGITEAGDHDFEADRRNQVSAQARQTASAPAGKPGTAGFTGASPKPPGVKE